LLQHHDVRFGSRSIGLVNFAFACLALVVISASAVKAAEITYTVDPTQSVLTASGTVFGSAPFSQQYVGIVDTLDFYPTLSASYSGTITANRNIQANTLQITGGNINAVDNGPYESNYSIATLDSYGFTQAYGSTSGSGSLSGGFSISYQGDLHSFSLSLSSPVITSASNFNASQLSATIMSGTLDSFAIIEAGNPLVGGMYFYDPASYVAGNLAFASSNTSLIDNAGIETLTIPVNTSFTVEVAGIASALTDDPLDDPLSVQIDLSGNIVATGIVPEPVCIGLVLGFAALLMRRRTRFGRT